jgi:hypothetical protein
MLNRFLYDLLRWTWDLNQWSAPARLERGTPKIDNSMRDEQLPISSIANCQLPIADWETHRMRHSVGDRNWQLAIGNRQWKESAIVELTLFPRAPYSGRSLFEGKNCW